METSNGKTPTAHFESDTVFAEVLPTRYIRDIRIGSINKLWITPATS
jgi:hypothetical protein